MNRRVAIVTGGRHGIGRAICFGLAAHGYAVVVAEGGETDSSPGPSFPGHASGAVPDVARTIREQGGTAVGIGCDLTRVDDIRSLVTAAVDRFGRIDVLVNNAGIDYGSQVVDLDANLLDRCLAVNVRAPLLLCKFVLPAMRARKSGSIIGITSGVGRAHPPGRVVDSLTRAALERTFLSLAEEVEPHNIAVNVLTSGRIARRGDRAGTGQVPVAQPDAMVSAIIWLGVQTATSFTGQVIDRTDFGITWGTGA